MCQAAFFIRGDMMDDLIYDAFSVMFQLLQLFAPDHAGDSGFLMIGYTFSCIFLIMVVWSLLKIAGAFSHAVLSWYTRR